MCVASGECSTSTGSMPSDATPSKIRSPDPSKTGAHRLAGVMGEHEHRSVVRRLRSPPPAPVLVPLTADRPEHVAAHEVGATRTHEPGGRRLVGLVGALVAQMPGVQLPPALAQRVL